MARRMNLLNKITRQLAVLACEVELMNRSNRMTLNSDAETIFCGLINRLEGWELGNLNEVAQNYPGIDLADPARRVAVQITASASQRKVDHTLTVFFKNKMERNFDRLILVIITDRTAPTTAHGVKQGFKFDPKKDIWNIEWFKRRMESIEDCEHLQALADYLDSQLGDLPGQVKRPAHLLPPVPGASENFLAGSRDAELEVLEKALEQGGPVFIWGLGGMGKTQTAIALAKRCAPPRGAYFLRYTIPADPGREAMFETIRRADLSGYTLEAGEETDPDVLMKKEYREKLEIIRREYDDALLVIDNFDCPGKTVEQLKSERAYQDLTALGIRLVFTTRYPADPAWEIGPLPEERLLELMRRSCTGHSDDQLLALIRAAGRHTLMADLMARTLEESWQAVTPEKILEALENAALDAADFPEVASDKDGVFAQAQIYKHLQALFNLSGLTEAAKKVLALAVLIAEEGLDDVLFLESLPAAEKKELQNLCKRGWLRREDHVITIHPAVLQVCRGELHPEEGNIRAFLDALWAAQEKRKCVDQTLRRVALCINSGAEKINDQSGAMVLRMQALSLWERILPADHPQLAARYSDVGLGYHAMGEHEKALRYTKKSLKIKKSVLPSNHPDLAMTYRNMGSTLMGMGKFDDGLEYQKKSLEIWKKVLPENHPDLGRAYYQMGLACFNVKEYKWARKYLQQAAQIVSAVLPDAHPDIRAIHKHLGRTYGFLGNFRDAQVLLDSMRTALEREGDTTSIEYGLLCLDCGEVYEQLGRKEKPEFFQNAVCLYRIAKEIFEKESPKLDYWLKLTSLRLDMLQMELETEE